jgi:hypothetical protein
LHSGRTNAHASGAGGHENVFAKSERRRLFVKECGGNIAMYMPLPNMRENMDVMGALISGFIL